MEFAAAALTSLASAGSAAAAGVGEAAAGIGSAVAGGVSSAVGGISSLFGGGAAAGGAAAGGSSLFSGSLFGNILQGGASLVGAMAASRAGEAQGAAYDAAAGDASLDAQNETVNASLRQDNLRRQLIGALGQRDTAYAASGVDLSFGTPVQARREADQMTDQALAQDQTEADQRRARLLERSSGYTAMAADARSAGNVKGAGLLLSGLGSILKRG